MAQSTTMDEGLKAFDNKNFSKALTELKPFADQGNCLAQFAVGFCYKYGEAIKNDSLALHWLEMAAEKKQVNAMWSLAAAYFTAGGKDGLIKAYLWGMLAREYDPRQQATTTITLLKMYMKPDELEKANELVELYKKRWRDVPNCE